MRILIAHSSYRVAGGEDQYIKQQVALLAPRHDIHLLRRDNRELTESVATAARMVFSHKTRAEINQVVEDFRPDVIHLHNPYPTLGPSIHLSARKHGIPLLQTIHNLRLRCPNGFMFTEGQVCRRCERGAYFNAVLHECFATRKQAAAYATALWSHRFILRLERDVAIYIAPSDFLRRRLLDWGVPTSRIKMIRNFVQPDPKASTDPGSHGIFVGRLSREKGLETLLKALSSAGDPPFLVVGEGPAKHELLGIAGNMGLENTRFLGWQEPARVRELLRRSRYEVIPSLWEENAPLAALEALAAGRPIIASDMGGIPELVREGAGFAVTPGDPHALRATIQRFLEDDELCRDMGGKALAFAHAHLMPEGHLAALEDAYAAATSRKM